MTVIQLHKIVEYGNRQNVKSPYSIVCVVVGDKAEAIMPGAYLGQFVEDLDEPSFNRARIFEWTVGQYALNIVYGFNGQNYCSWCCIGQAHYERVPNFIQTIKSNGFRVRSWSVTEFPAWPVRDIVYTRCKEDAVFNYYVSEIVGAP